MFNEQEGYVRPASPEELASWSARSVKGTAVNAVNDEFSGTGEQTWDYARYHQKHHRTVPDPQCKICQFDRVVKESTKTTPPCKQCGYRLEQHIGPTRECPV